MKKPTRVGWYWAKMPSGPWIPRWWNGHRWYWNPEGLGSALMDDAEADLDNPIVEPKHPTQRVSGWYWVKAREVQWTMLYYFEPEKRWASSATVSPYWTDQAFEEIDERPIRREPPTSSPESKGAKWSACTCGMWVRTGK